MSLIATEVKQALCEDLVNLVRNWAVFDVSLTIGLKFL